MDLYADGEYMKQIRLLAQYYVDLLVKLGLIRFSLLLASALVVLAMVVQMAVTFLLHGQVKSIDVVRSVFFGLLITPWAVYFLSVVVDQLEESRQRLAKLVDKLEEMRDRDLRVNQQMKETIGQLNQEINERKNAEQARESAIAKLREEMSGREKAQIELEQQSSFLRSFLDASPDLVFYRNVDHQFSGCNRALELLLGKSEKQLVGLTPEDIYDKETADKILETDDKVFRHNISLTYEQWPADPLQSDSSPEHPGTRASFFQTSQCFAASTVLQPVPGIHPAYQYPVNYVAAHQHQY